MLTSHYQLHYPQNKHLTKKQTVPWCHFLNLQQTNTSFLYRNTSSEEHKAPQRHTALLPREKERTCQIEIMKLKYFNVL